MVAETAVGDFKSCLTSFKLSDEKMAEQRATLVKTLAVKADEGASQETVKLYELLDTITEPLLKLTASVTNASREKLLKCEEEVANANPFIVRWGIGGSQLSIGKNFYPEL